MQILFIYNNTIYYIYIYEFDSSKQDIYFTMMPILNACVEASSLHMTTNICDATNHACTSQAKTVKQVLKSKDEKTYCMFEWRGP